MVNGDDIVKKALEYKDKVPYKFGKADPNEGFDCSGFVVFIYKVVANITLPHYTGDLIKKGVEVKKENLQKGDLVFPHEGHVSIYIGNNQVIHADKGINVGTKEITKFYAARRIL